jgi:hypothetical protein
LSSLHRSLKTIFAEGLVFVRSSSAEAGEIKEKVSAALIKVANPRLRARFAMAKV